MSSNIVFDLSSALRPADVHKIIDRIDQDGPTSVLFDWTLTDDADNLALCLVQNLSYRCEQNNIKVRHTSHERNLYFHNRIVPFFGIQPKNLELPVPERDVYLVRVETEKQLSDRQDELEQYLTQVQGLTPSRRDGLLAAFAELYSNCATHSWAKNDVCCVAQVPGFVELIASDLGVGIPSNIRDEHEGYEERSDAETLQFALSQESGGLPAVKSNVRSMGGEMHLYSGKGAVTIDANGEQAKVLDVFHSGTQVRVRVPLA